MKLRLEDEQEPFMRLLMRSPDQGDGWRAVSDMLRIPTERVVAQRPELYETKEVDGKFMVRLSERGIVLFEYL